MGQIATTIAIVLLWVISFVEPSGWADSINLSDKVNWTITLIALIYFIAQPSTRLNISSTLVLFTIISFIILPYVCNDSTEGATYLISFLTVYLLYQGTITEKVVKYSGIAIASLGLLILYVYVKGSILKGWNDNSISMTGLFSFVYFTIYLIQTKRTKAFLIWNVVTVVYLYFLFETDCRSGMLFSLITVFCIIFSANIKEYLCKDKLCLILLNVPLIIALLVIVIVSSPYFNELNAWSMETFKKSIFNGREVLWQSALDNLFASTYIGTGKFMMNYHNSGVAALSVFGLLGYYCWIKFFGSNMAQMKYYLDDNIVFGSMLAFIIIFLQQSVDLGIIQPIPNLLPYVILGVGLGRIRYLENEEG